MGDSGPFIFRVPVWIPIVESTHLAHGLPAGIAMLTAPTTGRLFALFTDEDTARSFLSDWGEPDRTVYEVTGKGELLGFLRTFQNSGVKYVGIDCPAGSNPTWRLGRVCPIELFIAAVEAM